MKGIIIKRISGSLKKSSNSAYKAFYIKNSKYSFSLNKNKFQKESLNPVYKKSIIEAPAPVIPEFIASMGMGLILSSFDSNIQILKNANRNNLFKTVLNIPGAKPKGRSIDQNSPGSKIIPGTGDDLENKRITVIYINLKVQVTKQLDFQLPVLFWEL